MPQVDLETLVTACAGGGGVNDRKIACETLADDDAVHTPPDFPPESFCLSKDAEYDWFDRNAFLERKESTKGNNSNQSNLNPNPNPVSQRNSLNVKSIIRLPKTQKATFVDAKRRACKPANIRLFPKRSESVGKSTGPLVEPGSPKVSCMGRVRSKRSRRSEKTEENSRTGAEKKKTGFYSKIMSVFRSGKNWSKPDRTGGRQMAEDKPIPSLAEPPRRSSVNGDAPGLGGMKHFASGRRSTEDFNEGDFDRRVGGLGRS